MSIVHVNESDFAEVILKAPLAVVDFWAVWCGPCKMFAPALEELSDLVGDGAVVAKVDVDECPTLAQQYGIMSIPTVLVFKNGELVEQQVGVQPASALHDMLKSYM